MVDQNGPENLEYFKYLDSMIIGDARCVTEIISRIAICISCIQRGEFGANWTLKENRIALFWAQRIVEISYRRFGTTNRTPLQRSRFFTSENGTVRLSRNVGKKLPLLAA